MKKSPANEFFDLYKADPETDVPEFRRQLELEDKLARAIYAEWSERSNIFLEMLLASEISEESVSTKYDKVFRPYPSRDLRALISRTCNEFYKLSKKAISNYESGDGPLPVFKADARDKKVNRFLAESAGLWLAKRVKDVKNKLLNATRDVLQNMTGQALKDRMQEVSEKILQIGDNSDAGLQHALSVTVTTSTLARSLGAVFELSRLGYRKYKFDNPMDERTSRICRSLFGQEFYLSDATAQAEALLDSKTTDDIVNSMGWNRDSDIVEAEFGLPPFHNLCRTTIIPA